MNEAPVSHDGEAKVIVAFLGTQALGDYVYYHQEVASVARAFPGSRLLMIFRDDRPYKSFVAQLNPWITDTLVLPEDPSFCLPADWFNGETVGEGRPFGEDWYEKGYHAPDLFLSPSMMSSVLTRCVGEPPRFRIPQNLEQSLQELLTRSGVLPDRWFACLHVRESGYQWRQAGTEDMQYRDADPKSYLPMINDIIDNQGGQVVRLGDPSMTPLVDRPGFIDLSHVEGSFPLQAYAVARARYLVATQSGTASLATAFYTPTLMTNALGFTIMNQNDAILYQGGLELADGERLNAKEFLSIIDDFPGIPKGLKHERNSAEELCRAADIMTGRTSDCAEWRNTDENLGADESQEQGTLEFPLSYVTLQPEKRYQWL